MSSPSARPPVPDWQLERHRLGELPAPQEAAVRQALAADQTLRGRLAALDQDDAEVLERHPPRQVAARVRARLAAPPRPRLRRPVLALALGALGVAGITVLAPALMRPTPPPPSPPALPDETRTKGLSPHLLVFRQGEVPSEVERLPPGSSARPHDLVQVAYQAAGRRYGVIVSIDGRGVVTRHLPARGPQAAALKAGPVALPQAYELDDAPAFERFYLVAADAPFAVERVVAAVRRRHGRGAPAPGDPALLDLPPTMDQFAFVLRKESAR